MRLILFFVVCITTCGLQSQISDDGLLLYYPFNGNFEDASGNGFDGAPFGPVFATDAIGNPHAAIYFDGEDDYLNFPNAEDLKVPLPVSFSFWINYTGDNYQEHAVFNTSMEEDHATSVVFNAQAGTNRYVINYADGEYFYGPQSRRSYVSNSVIEPDNWHHITIVVNGPTAMQIYVDCVEAGGEYSGFGGPLVYSLQPGCIGRHDRTLSTSLDYFKGYIDEFRYWDRALTTNEILKLCNEDLLVVADIPKGVSPDDDGMNDTFDLSGMAVGYVKIFNRYGMKVYEKADYANQWNGKDDHGRELPSGTYYYQVQLQSGKTKTGWVYLQRKS